MQNHALSGYRDHLVVLISAGTERDSLCVDCYQFSDPPGMPPMTDVDTFDTRQPLAKTSAENKEDSRGWIWHLPCLKALREENDDVEGMPSRCLLDNGLAGSGAELILKQFRLVLLLAVLLLLPAWQS